MLKSLTIDIGSIIHITERKSARHVTITIKYNDNSEFQKTEVLEESDFQSTFGMILEKAKKEFLREYKKNKNNDTYIKNHNDKSYLEC